MKLNMGAYVEANAFLVVLNVHLSLAHHIMTSKTERKCLIEQN